MSDTNTDFEIERPIKRENGDTMEETLTTNAYQNILPARYLRKNEQGELVETPEKLFERIAKNVALADALYLAEQADKPITVTPDQIKANYSDRDELAEEVFGPGVSTSDDVTTELTEENISKFSYDTIVPEQPTQIADEVARVKDEFQANMEKLGVMPNSPTIMNAGDELQQLSACFVNSPGDDIRDIHDKVADAADVFQSGGGMGYAFHTLRPYGDVVGSTGGVASGPISFMRTFDQMCATIAAGGKRRGAQMGVMRVSHPDIIHFIHAKNKDVSLKESLKLNDPDDFEHNSFSEALEEASELIDEDGQIPKHLRNAAEGHLSNFNISVGVTDGFMDALFNDEEYTLINPRTQEPHIATAKTEEMYSWYDLEDHVEVGEELSIPATVLWERMIEGAHENGEPGVVYIDQINKDHSYDVESHCTIVDDDPMSQYEVHATNPCGEQQLMEGEACNLCHINLSTIVDQDAPDWRDWLDTHSDDYISLAECVDNYLEVALDYEELDSRIQTGTHFLENVVTMSDFPLDKIEQTVADNRKIGLGIMGLAQMYIQLGVKYGTKEGNEIAEQVMKHINHGSKQVSHELAQRRGVFANWEDSKYASPLDYEEWFERQTGESAAEYADGFKIRNHNTTTIAPTGTTSMLGNTTGGCEPMYNVAYYKNVSGDVQGDEMLVEFDDYFMRMLEANDVDADAVKQEAQELMQANEFDGVDDLETVPERLTELFVTTADLSAHQHASVQCALQKGVDAAISKTTNAPHDSSLEDAKEVFEYIYKNGGKGVTYYRDGTRAKQVLTTRAQNSEFSDDGEAAEVITEQILDSFGSLDDFVTHDEVQETFAGELESLSEAADAVTDGVDEAVRLNDDGFVEPRERPDSLPGITQRIDTGYGKLYVNINEDVDGYPFEVFCNIGNSGGFTSSFTESLAKVVSSALRARIDPEEIQNDLEGIRSPKVAWDRGEQISSIPDAVGTAIRRHLNDEIDQEYPTQSTIDEATDTATPDTTDTSATTEETPVGDGGTVQASSGETDDITKIIQEGDSPECPSCNQMALAFVEGCKTCENCGWSKC
ncbi:ribonucleotide reductase alpha chain [environmental halophage 1 AAJ-2005]|nr:ribonucleotide reductase alpha chain [environmental halophage 1 AAJ-2005]